MGGKTSSRPTERLLLSDDGLSQLFCVSGLSDIKVDSMRVRMNSDNHKLVMGDEQCNDIGKSDASVDHAMHLLYDTRHIGVEEKFVASIIHAHGGGESYYSYNDVEICHSGRVKLIMHLVMYPWGSRSRRCIQILVMLK